MDTLRALTENAGHREQAQKLDAERDTLIIQARHDGYTWEQIADAANMSRAGVIHAHNKALASR